MGLGEFVLKIVAKRERFQSGFALAPKRRSLRRTSNLCCPLSVRLAPPTLPGHRGSTPADITTPSPAASWSPSLLTQVQKNSLSRLRKRHANVQKGASIGGGGLILNWEDSCLPGDTWQSLEKVFGCHNWGWGCADGSEWVESRDAAKHPAVHMTAPPPPPPHEKG